MLELELSGIIIGVAPTLNVAYDVVLVGESRSATQRSELNGVSVEVLGSTYPSESLAAGEGVESCANVDGLLERIVGYAVIVGFLQSCGIDVDVVGIVDSVGIEHDRLCEVLVERELNLCLENGVCRHGALFHRNSSYGDRSLVAFSINIVGYVHRLACGGDRNVAHLKLTFWQVGLRTDFRGIVIAASDEAHAQKSHQKYAYLFHFWFVFGGMGAAFRGAGSLPLLIII